MRQRFVLAKMVAESSITWSCPLWAPNQRQLSKIRGTFNKHLLANMRTPRMFGESEEHFCHRCRTALKAKKKELHIVDLDIIVIRRMFSWLGHLVRVGRAQPDRLINIVLDFYSRQELVRNRVAEGHMGHPGRFSPWTYEGQFDQFFSATNQYWTDTAIDRTLWKSFTEAFVKHKECKLYETAIT
jgi:hypothetical protein